MDHPTIPSSPTHDPSDIEGTAMLTALRLALRRAGWTQVRIANELGIGIATVKRWLSGRGLTFQMLGRLCALADCTIAELAQDAGEGVRGHDQLTLTQEEALTEDADLSTIFFLIVNGWPISEATEAFHIAVETVERHVARLERLALVDRLSGGRVRARIDPAHAWQRAPMRRHFERHLKKHFFSLDYGHPDTIFGAETIKLSPVGVGRVEDRIAQFRNELRAIAQDDRRNATLPGEWYAVLAVARSMAPLIKP
jgi:transcriptional regulator with XRE-family HTH domain